MLMKWCPAMRTPIQLPELGAASVVLTAWFADLGEAVYAGDRLVEVCLDGATFDVSCPATGLLVEKLALPEDPLTAGQVLGIVEGG
jgi:pyruvate/2-oxoglutarate dehydrogenase complex dihydrolipoamide acyltransferase (E2) component